jgi:hypothetical protein
MHQGYYTAFELGYRTFPWIEIVSPIVFFAIGLFLIKIIKTPAFRVVMGAVMFLQGLIYFGVKLPDIIPRCLRLRRAYISSHSLTVTGVVQSFTPAPRLGPQLETFRVGGVKFSYNILDDTPCLHTSHLHERQIENGSFVRIYYYDGCIQRVDFLEPQSNPETDDFPPKTIPK